MFKNVTFQCIEIFVVLVCICSIGNIYTKAYAANTIISVSPATGSYSAGVAFTVSVVIDGHGDNFNAAQATVSIPPGLIVTGITLGDCNFSFVTTPTTSNPSFTGVILGGSSQKCTVYSLTLFPVSQGSAVITITNAEVKSYPTAQDTLIGLQNSNFTIAPSVAPVTPPQTVAPVNTNGSPYTITVQAISQNNTPLSGAIVVLDQNQNQTSAPAVSPTPATLKVIPTQSFVLPPVSPQEAKTDSNGIAQFNNVPPGIHTAAVLFDNKLVGKTIINAWGPQHTITLGIKTQKPKFPLTLALVTAFGGITLLIVFFFLFRYIFV